MDILKSLNEVRKNSSNFKKWETEQDSTEQKREELAKRKPPTPEEIQGAKEMGKTIIDVVDIMDQHSEDVAENVETASAIPMSVIPWAVLIGGGFLSNKMVIKPADKKIEALKAEFLSKNKAAIEEIIKEAKEHSPKSWVSERHMLSKRRVKQIKAPSHTKVKAEKLFGEWEKLTKNLGKTKNIGTIVPIVGAVVAFVLGNAYATKMQVGSSKIARFQARKILEDPKYFVKYTPEQIAEAKRVLDAQDEKTKKKKKTKTDKLKGGMFKSFFSLARDAKAYKEWKNNYNEASQKITRPLTPEEIIKAKKDQEVIQRVVRKINNNAEVYSENMEVAAGVIIGGTPFLGAGVGWVVSKIMNFTNVIPNYVQKYVAKNGSEEAKEAYEVLKKAMADPKAQNKFKLYWNFHDAMMKSDINKKTVTKGFSGLVEEAKKFIPTVLSTKMGKNIVFSAVGAGITATVGLIMALKLQKASARAGRYVAKQELEKNPQNFIGYTDEEFNEVEAGPARKKPSKFKEYALFIPNVIKQYYQYNHYKKHELRDDKLLQDELVKLNVSDNQLKEAKNLQRKVFNTFEKVDDKSQTYSESMEMATETAQPFVMFGGIALALSPIIAFGIQAYRGKITPKTMTNKIINILSKATWISKQKFFKKYLTNVAKKASTITSEVDKKYVEDTVLKKIIPNIKLREIIKQRGNITVGETIDMFTKTAQSITKEDAQELLRTLKWSSATRNIEKIREISSYHFDKSQLFNILNEIKAEHGSKRLFSEDIMKQLGKISQKINVQEGLSEISKRVGEMTDAQFKSFMESASTRLEDMAFFRNFDLSSVDKAYVQKAIPKVQKILSNIPKDEVKNILGACLDEFNKNPDQFMHLLKTGGITKIFMTNGLKTAMAAAGVSWVVISMSFSYLIESWLADMQLKAGRLGVMKALEELKDPAYYADIETVNKGAQTSNTQKSVTDASLMNKFKK